MFIPKLRTSQQRMHKRCSIYVSEFTSNCKLLILLRTYLFSAKKLLPSMKLRRHAWSLEKQPIKFNTKRVQQVILFGFRFLVTAVTGVGSSPALATCETNQVLLAGVSVGFPRVLPLRPTYRLARLDMSEIILKGTLN